MVQTCCKCSVEKPIESFVKCSRKKTGYTRRCKTCHAEVSQKSVEGNPESRKAAYLKYYQSHKLQHREAVYRWQKNNPEKVAAIKERNLPVRLETARKWRKENGRQSSIKMRESYPLKYKARTALNNAVANGKLPRISSVLCRSCGGQAQDYHHHNGYAERNWLNVIPLCRKCHALAG